MRRAENSNQGLWELAVLCCLKEDPMHPYEIQRVLKERKKDEVLALKKGSLYHAIGRLLKAGLIDELIIYMAPRLLGDSARGMFSVPAIESLAAGWSLEVDDVRRLGPDLRLTARVSRVAAP